DAPAAPHLRAGDPAAAGRQGDRPARRRALRQRHARVGRRGGLDGLARVAGRLGAIRSRSCRPALTTPYSRNAPEGEQAVRGFCWGLQRSRIARWQVVLKQTRLSFFFVIPAQIVLLHSLMALLQSTLQLFASAVAGAMSRLDPRRTAATAAVTVRP